MLILLEGVDGSGKTTLCNQLRKEKFVIKKPIDRIANFPYTSWSNLVAESAISKQDFIFDRSFISELVYRTTDKKEIGTMAFLDMCYILNYCKIILCETNTSFEDAMTRGEDNIIDRQVSNQIKQAYRTIVTMLNKFLYVPTFVYDWQHQTIDDVIKFINNE